MAASAISRPIAAAGLPTAATKATRQSNLAFHPRWVAAIARPAPLEAMPRRHIRSAAAQEALIADVKLAAWLVVGACCIGFGLALGIHFDEILADVRLVAFNAEEPRWLWSVVDAL